MPERAAVALDLALVGVVLDAIDELCVEQRLHRGGEARDQLAREPRGLAVHAQATCHCGSE